MGLAIRVLDYLLGSVVGVLDDPLGLWLKMVVTIRGRVIERKPSMIVITSNFPSPLISILSAGRGFIGKNGGNRKVAGVRTLYGRGLRFLPMSLRIVFLGTTGSVPTRSRGMPSIAIQREGDLILFDAGEGTQRQMISARLSPLKVSSIFITHLHGDHFLGLAGLVQTMSLFSREAPLTVYCPEGESERLRSHIFSPKYDLTFDLEIRELSPGDEVRMSGYRVIAAEADHTIPSLVYALVEDARPGRLDLQRAISLGIPPGPTLSRLKAGESVELPDGRIISPDEVVGPPRRGRKIVYTGDTRPSETLIPLARHADILIHDCTLSDEFVERARESGHSTPSGAAEIARRAEVRLLILFHISPRHEDASPLLEQARRIFPNTIVAEDLAELEVPYPE